MKKKFILLLCLVVSAIVFACFFVLSSCGGGNVLYVYNWTDYIEEGVTDAFEAKTGIKVVYKTYESNEELYIKLKQASTSPFDIVIPSDFMIERMIVEDMLEKIDFSKIPNYVNVDGRFKGLPFDTANEYYVPYMWGTLGILYNTTMVLDPIDSWKALWDDTYRGRIYMYDSQRDSIGVALKMLGFSYNNTNVAQLDLAKRALIEQKPLLQMYAGDIAKDKLVAREGTMGVTFSGDAIVAMRKNKDLAFVVPKEGSNLWVDGMVIPKGARNKANAEAFINFLCDPEIARQNTDHIGYSTTNRAAFNLLPAELRSDPVYWPGEEVLSNLEMYKNLGNFMLQYDIAWNEIDVTGHSILGVDVGFWQGFGVVAAATLLLTLIAWMLPPKKKEELGETAS